MQTVQTRIENNSNLSQRLTYFVLLVQSCPYCPILSTLSNSFILSNCVHLGQFCPYCSILSILFNFVHIVHIVQFCPYCPILSVLSILSNFNPYCPTMSNPRAFKLSILFSTKLIFLFIFFQTSKVQIGLRSHNGIL